MQHHPVVSREEWLKARNAHLTSEKELSRMRDRLAAERQALPWVKVEKDYVFDTPEGEKRLADLFGGKSQLIVYHFMWRWDLGQGCVSCSFLGDHFDGANIHLANHDVSFVAISRGKLEDIVAYKRRLVEISANFFLWQRFQFRLRRFIHQGTAPGEGKLQL